MVSLALTIASGLFLTATACTVLWVVYVIVGFIVLGTRELCKFYWREMVKELKELTK